MIAFRASLLTWRAARERRRTLERELGEYRTKADLLDLEAMIARQAPERVCEIEEILNQQALARQRRSVAGFAVR